jgi:hypothetical protein
MKIFIRELGFFIVLSLGALSLLPLVVEQLPLASEAYTVNRMEKLFIIELSILVFLTILVVLYILRFILTLIFRKLLGGGGGAVKP